MPVKKLFAIYGSGGFSREVMPILISMKGVTRENVCFVVDEDYLPKESSINGFPILTFEDFKSKNIKNKFITIAISHNKVRKELYDKCTTNKINHQTLIFSNTCILDDVTIGAGSIICPFVTLTSNIIIGKSFHANIYSYVAHDCQIGDYVTFAPKVCCNGNVHIHDYAYIGTGAIIKQGTPEKPLVIGKGAIVGMGAVVTKDVAPYEVVVGNPAKPFTK